LRRAARRLVWLPLLTAGVLAPACAPEQVPQRRVVLISLDTLRYDGFAADDDAASQMPLTFDRAGRGARFTHYYASTSTTQPTHATLFTGLQPWQHEIVRNGVMMGDEHLTVAEILKAEGFETRAVVASFPLARRFGFAQGFDHYVEDFDREHSARRWEGEWRVPDRKFYALGDAVTDRAIESIEQARAAEQFFFFHYFDPHAPYGAWQGETLTKNRMIRSVRQGAMTAEQALTRARELYAADLRQLDRSLDRLLARLERDAERIETHILVVSDHGESFGENGGFLGHGWTLGEEQLRGPAFILSPRVEPGVRGDLAGSIDVPRTLLAFAGVEPPSDSIGGRSLVDPATEAVTLYGMRKTAGPKPVEDTRIDGRTIALERYLFYAIEQPGQILRGNSGGLEGGEAVAPEMRARLAELFGSLERRVEEFDAKPVEMDPEVRRGLEALGYVE
jgi:arylsulfatase